MLAVESQPSVLGPVVLVALLVQPQAPHLDLQNPSGFLDALYARFVHVEELGAVTRPRRHLVDRAQYLHWLIQRVYDTQLALRTHLGRLALP